MTEHTKHASNGADIDTLRADLATLREDFKELTSHAGSIAGKQASRLSEAAKDKAGEIWDATRSAGDTAVKTSRKTISANPLASVAIAFGVGLVVGKLMDRR